MLILTYFTLLLYCEYPLSIFYSNWVEFAWRKALLRSFIQYAWFIEFYEFHSQSSLEHPAIKVKQNFTNHNRLSDVRVLDFYQFTHNRVRLLDQTLHCFLGSSAFLMVFIAEKLFYSAHEISKKQIYILVAETARKHDLIQK